MTELELVPYEEVLNFVEPHAEARAMRDGTSASGWKVTKKKGAISGVGASVSGLGAYAALKGKMSFTLKQMESSKTYSKMVNDYSISGGVSGFWGWLGIGANASTHKTEIQESLKEMASSQAVKGTVDVDLMVTGIYPNVQVDASAYVLVLQITDDQGSTVTVFSSTGPVADVGAQDQSGQDLKTKNNNSTITI
jgi:hypothetical protein